MVELLINGLRKDPRFTVFHIDARISPDISDLGGISVKKIVKLLRFCAEAIWIRLLHGPMDLYYVPAPAKRSAVVRDWIVMLLVRPWFRRIILHWHAFGLGHWVASAREHPTAGGDEVIYPPSLFSHFDSCARWVTKRLLRHSALSVVLTEYNRKDIAVFKPLQTVVVANGIDFEFADDAILARKIRHTSCKLNIGYERDVNLLYIGHCMESKGLLDALKIVAKYRSRYSGKVRLTVAGLFPSRTEKKQFDDLVAELQLTKNVTVAGYVDGDKKKNLFSQADVLLFPTYYEAETFGLVLLEAMAVGLPCLITRWRGIPELLPEAARFLMNPKEIHEGLESLIEALTFEGFYELHEHFKKFYEKDAHLLAIKNVLLNVG